MLTDIAQEFDVADLVQPVGIIDHDGVCRAVAKLQERLKSFLYPFDIVGNILLRKDRTGFFLVSGVTYFRCAAAHQDNRFAACLLQAPEHHDADQRADVEAISGSVKPDISDRRASTVGVELSLMGDLLDVAALI